MKQEVIERVRELAAGNSGPLRKIERPAPTNANPNNVEVSFVLLDEDEKPEDRELRLRDDQLAELARWLLLLFDENEAQAEYTIRVLQFISSSSFEAPAPARSSSSSSPAKKVV